MRALVSLTENCGTNPGWADWGCYTETPYPLLLSFYFLMEPYLLPFVIHCLLLSVPNMHNAQKGTSSFKSRNIDDGTPSLLV